MLNYFDNHEKEAGDLFTKLIKDTEKATKKAQKKQKNITG
jgi:hypothetical protein